jgi:hypothetical protein
MHQQVLRKTCWCKSKSSCHGILSCRERVIEMLHMHKELGGACLWGDGLDVVDARMRRVRLPVRCIRLLLQQQRKVLRTVSCVSCKSN